MDVTEFIQKSHSPNDLIEICQRGFGKSRERPKIAKNIKLLERMMKEKWQPPQIKLAELLTYPGNSIGNNLGLYLIGMNKDQSGKHSIPGWLRFKLRYEQGYGSVLATRVKQTHDICHMLTNFNTSQMGEIAVQGFYLGQRAHALSIMFIYDLLGSHLRGEKDREYIDAFMEGMNIGLNANEDVAFLRYELMLDKNLDEIRQELNIKAETEPKPWRNYLGKLEPSFEMAKDKV